MAIEWSTHTYKKWCTHAKCLAGSATKRMRKRDSERWLNQQFTGQPLHRKHNNTSIEWHKNWWIPLSTNSTTNTTHKRPFDWFDYISVHLILLVSPFRQLCVLIIALNPQQPWYTILACLCAFWYVTALQWLLLLLFYFCCCFNFVVLALVVLCMSLFNAC